MPDKHRSPSQFNMCSTCTAQWAYKYVLNVSEKFVPNIYLRIGKYLHDAVKKYLDDPKWLDANFLSQELAKEHPPEEGLSVVDYLELVSLFTSEVKKYKITKDNTEIFIKTNLNGMEVIGYTDLIDKETSTIIDWKIKGSKQVGTAYHHWTQLGFYSMVLGVPNCKNVYFILEKRKKSDKVSLSETNYRFSEKDYSIIKRYMSNLLIAMDNIEKTKVYWPNRGFLCSYCGFQDICQKEFGEI